MPVDAPHHTTPLADPARMAALARTGLLDTAPEEVFDRLTRLAARLLSAPAGALSLVVPDRQFLKSQVGFPDRWRRERSMPLAYSFCQHVVTSGEPLVITDAREDPRVRDSPAVDEDGSIAYLGVPVRVDGQVVGAFCVLDREPRAWSDGDVELLQELSAAVLTAIAHLLALRAAAESRASERRLAAQNAVARILAGAPTLEAAAGEILGTLCDTLGWHTGVFWKADPEAGVLVCVTASSCVPEESAFAEMSRRMAFLPGVGVPGRVWQAGEPVWVPDLGREPELPRARAAAASGLRGLIAFPLRADGEVIGVMEFGEHHSAGPDAELVEVMAALGGQIEPFVSRKRAEAEFRRTAAIVEQSSDAIIASGPDGLITSWNRGAERLFGYSAAEAVGRSPRFVIPPERRHDMEWIRAELAAGHAVEGYETERLHRDGHRVWVSLSATPIPDPEGRPAGMATIGRDITAQRHTQDRLRQSEAELRAILSALPDAIIVFGADGHVLRVTPNAPHLLVRPACEMVGRRLADLLPAEEAERFLAVIHHVLAAGEKMTFEYGLPIGRRDVMFEATVSPMDSETVIWAARDVTARVQAERQAREKQAQLAQAQKMDAVGRLAGGVAHDFNNLLTVIRGTVQLLLLDLPPDDPIAQDLRTIDEAGATAAALTAQLLTFTRKQPARIDVVDVNAVVRGIVPLLRRLIGEHIQVRTRLAPGPVEVRADRSQLEQVVLNLAINARDAMPDGGRMVLETALETGAGGGGRAAGGVVVLSVTDTGTGMPPETVARVFEPFFTTKPPGEGTGLGLATVHDIVRQGGGRVEVESTPGEGSCFRASLPAARGRPEPAPEVPRPRQAPQAAARVLVVEDEKDVRAILRRSLERAGHQVVEAATGAEALRLLRDERGLDLVVTDGVLPDMRGHAVAAQARALLPDVPVLLVSGYSGGAMGRVPPGVPFLQKPFSPSEFLRRTGELLAAAGRAPAPPGNGRAGGAAPTRATEAQHG